MEKSKKKKYLIAGIVFTILIMVGTSYAWWTSTAKQKGINEIQSTCIEMELTGEKGEISLPNAYPLTDEEAKKLTPYTFTITNTCKTTIDYTVKLEQLKNNENENNLLKSKYVAVEFNEGQKQILSEYPKGTPTYDGSDYTTEEARELIKGTLTGSESKEYKIKLWMDESVEATNDTMNKSFISKIVVDGNINELATYDEPILHGADPVLESSKSVAIQTASEEPTTNDKLIPVIIDDNGTVTRANLAHDWYNYEEKRWANAVILADNAKEYKDGETIPENAIESYFVWIPKYRYKIQTLGESSTGNEKSFDIKFDLENTKDEIKDECKTPNKSGENGECAVGKWMTHPAFTAFPNSKGMWVGKFETGYKQTEDFNIETWTQQGAEKDESDITKVIIKPNVYSWRYVTLANMYKTSFEYQRDLDSHMMKNTEWAAIAYLSHSKYGTCNNNKCTEIRINNTQNFATGFAATIATTFENNQYGEVILGQDTDFSFNYKDPSSTVSSTTGNYSGVFDMSGGAYEYMMGIYKIDGYGQTGFTEETFPKNSKYYDEYLNKGDEYNTRILGDASAETKNWYLDEILYVNNEVYISVRSSCGTDATKAGIFYNSRWYGSVNNNETFRIVLTPIN